MPREGNFRLDRPAGIGGSVVVLVLIVILLAAVAALHWLTLPNLENSRLFTVGGFAEMAIWLLLFSVLVSVHLRTLPRVIYLLLTVGLAIWLVSQTADLMDEFLVQPLWISAYGEDSARVAGMLLVTLGVLSLIRHSATTMEELERLSYRDSLTGLANRRMLGRTTDAFGDRPYSLLMLDLDHFKSINDEYGHDAGDRVLREIAELLRQRFGDRGEVFRLGGEEFAVVVEGGGEDELLRMGEEVRRAVDEMRGSSGESLTVSVGVGTRRPDELPGQLMRRVDRALYRAKDAGRDRVEPAI